VSTSAIDVQEKTVVRTVTSTHNVVPEAEALPLKITYGDIEGKPVLRIPYCTHKYEPGPDDLRLKIAV